MNLFQSDGHLTEEAFQALTDGELPEISRLEISEHLAYCNDCLERYTAFLTDDTLLSPPETCRGSGLWRRIHVRTFKIFSNRYAAAAAAVILMLAALWGSTALPRQTAESTGKNPPRTAVSQQLENWPKRWSKAFDKTFSGLSKVLDIFDGNNTPSESKGGSKS